MSYQPGQPNELETLREVWRSLTDIFINHPSAPDSIKMTMASNIVYNVAQRLRDREALEAVK